MPIDTGEIKEGVVDYFSSGGIIAQSLKNPFYSAFLVIIVLLIIMLFVFRDLEIDGDESYAIHLVRFGFYGFIFLSLYQFLQNHITIKEYKEYENKKDENAAFAPIIGSGKAVPVTVAPQKDSAADIPGLDISFLK